MGAMSASVVTCENVYTIPWFLSLRDLGTKFSQIPMADLHSNR